MNTYPILKWSFTIFIILFSYSAHAASTLYGGQTLRAGQQLTSPNGTYRLVMQGDGNLVLYDSGNRARWHTSTQNNPGSRLVMQTDGNLVIYSSRNRPLWQTQTDDFVNKKLRLQLFSAGYLTLRIGSRERFSQPGGGRSLYGKIIWRSHQRTTNVFEGHTLSAGRAPFGKNEGSLRVIERSTIRHRSIECTKGEWEKANHWMHFAFRKYTSETDLRFIDQGRTPVCSNDPVPYVNDSSYTNIYWYVAPSWRFSEPDKTVADTRCMRWYGNVCLQYRIRWNSKLLMRSDNRLNAALHEIGHAIGFDHGTAANNVMDHGNNGKIDAYMKRRINSYY